MHLVAWVVLVALNISCLSEAAETALDDLESPIGEPATASPAQVPSSIAPSPRVVVKRRRIVRRRRIKAPSKWKWDFDPEVTYTGVAYNSKIQNTRQYQNILEIDLPFTARYSEDWKFRILPMAHWDPSNNSKVPDMRFTAKGNEQLYTDLKEGYVQYGQAPFSVQIGYNIFSWGVTDGYNPLDVVNPRRYLDPIKNEKISTPALALKGDPTDWLSLEGIYIPKQRRSLLPGERSRWLPRDVFKSRSFDTGGSSTGDVVLNMPDNIGYTYGRSYEAPNAMKNNFGARAQMTFSGLDLSFIAFKGAAAMPMVKVDGLPLGQLDITPTYTSVNVVGDIALRRYFYDRNTFGGSAVYVLGDYIVKGAYAYTNSVKKCVEASDVLVTVNSGRTAYCEKTPGITHETVLGVERTFGFGNSQVTLLVQRTRVIRKDDSQDNTGASLARMFDKAWMLAARYAYGEKWTFLASALSDTVYKGTFAHFDLGYRIRDGLQATASIDLLNGRKETPIGTYSKNDRGMLGLNYHF